MTRLCVAIFVTDEAQARRDIALAAERGADVVELRVDSFPGDYTEIAHRSLVPAIITCRPVWEGGQSTEPDRQRFDGLAFAAHLTYAVDIELETYRRLRFERGDFGRLIFSMHDFDGRPLKPTNLVAELYDSPADIVKIVWTARTIRDNLEAFEILKNQIKPTIAICMGEAGLVSRVLAKKFNAFLTFASLDDTTGTAPGQVSVTDMKRLYRWDAVGADTKVFGVVGSPVGHSLSPAIHNAAFDATGFDGIYLPMLVNPGYESFKAFMESFVPFDGLHLSGLSVTIPHKENALRYLKEKGAAVEPLAGRIGAVNTIVIGPDRSLRGMNTDYAAILDTITEALSVTREQLVGRRVAVLGAGGTGRTAVAALAAAGATTVVYNRTRDRADALAAEFNGTPGKVVAAGWEKICDSCCEIYVNTTSVGMHPKVDESPMGGVTFSPGDLVFDVIYNPAETKLLKDARAAGAITVGGAEMFVKQAAAQFTAWTGIDAPVGVMRGVIESR